MWGVIFRALPHRRRSGHPGRRTRRRLGPGPPPVGAPGGGGGGGTKAANPSPALREELSSALPQLFGKPGGQGGRGGQSRRGGGRPRGMLKDCQGEQLPLRRVTCPEPHTLPAPGGGAGCEDGASSPHPARSSVTSHKASQSLPPRGSAQ